MTFHYIAIASDFVNGKRIAWHYSSEDRLDKEKIRLFMKKAEIQGSTFFGVHKLTTNSEEWKSVVEKDSFFEDVLATENEDELFRLLEEDKEIHAMDVATFILALKSMSHLKLQKLLYLVYADYLSRYHEPLFKDDIVTYKYGPVVEKVYQLFKKYGAEKINDSEKYAFWVKDTVVPPLLMKLSNSNKGEKAIESILNTIRHYENYTANQLVTLTHSKDSPWSKTYNMDNVNAVIIDETILQYHVNESNT
ncbi:Panacea domain-containing protein [Marinilactibacillus kalidii]|uniref:Panacea domain-containing protein n=1 Tax=Marinilactibacillus kalidii TaxID=2820274 RepID=UPI001ABEDEB3|nr:type II toxin-antitoxin system antitoxin SocA domain-containing protein [Marinilactibacillus kalidii]